MSVIRLILLGAVVAVGWFAISLAASGTPAQAAAPAAGSSHSAGGDDTREDGLRGILSTVKGSLTPVIEITANTLNDVTEPARDTVEATVKPIVTTTTDLARELTEWVGTTIGDTVSDTVDTVLPVLPTLPDLPGDSTPALETPTALTHPANDPSSGHDQTASLATAVQQLTETLWPLADPPEPWNPRDLRLTSSGALTTSGSSAGNSTCDLPLVERWLTLSIAATEPTAAAVAPGTPTYDTDCTPD